MIDWTRVEELRNEIGPEDFAEVAELFLMEVEDTLSRLGTAKNDASTDAGVDALLKRISAEPRVFTTGRYLQHGRSFSRKWERANRYSASDTAIQ